MCVCRYHITIRRRSNHIIREPFTNHTNNSSSTVTHTTATHEGQRNAKKDPDIPPQNQTTFSQKLLERDLSSHLSKPTFLIRSSTYQIHFTPHKHGSLCNNPRRTKPHSLD